MTVAFKVPLKAPNKYRLLTSEQKAKIVNGCGPAKLGFLVPDKIYGLDITDV